MLFKDDGAVGRIPYLMPVKWEDGWPVLGVNGKVPSTLSLAARTTGKGGASGIVASYEFTRTPGQPPLPLAWQWNYNPDNRYWSLSERPGFLRLTTGRVDANFVSARNSLTQRTFGPRSSGIIALDVSHMKDGDVAGLGLLQSKYGFVGVKAANGAKSVVMASVEGGAERDVERVPLAQSLVYLKIECDFQNRADNATFFYSLDGAKWIAIGQPLHMVYTLEHFMGARFALFNYATQTPGGFVDFDFFHISD